MSAYDDPPYEEICRLFDKANAAYAALVRYQLDHWVGWALGFRAGRALQEAHHRACVAHHAACVAADLARRKRGQGDAGRQEFDH